MENTNEITKSIKEFILGGDARFTILQEATEKTPSYQVKYRVKNNGSNTCWFVSTELFFDDDLFTDGRKLTYQGYLKRDLSFNIGAKGVEDYNQKAIRGLLWVLNHPDNLPSIVHIFHHGRCSVCGRKLTDAKSLRCGIGPTCRKKVNIYN